MWILVVFMIVSGEVQITERGFTSESHCEARAGVWRKQLDLKTYHVSCAPAENEIKDRRGGRRDTV